MLISVRNPALYRQWIALLGGDSPQKRFAAYVHSQAGDTPTINKLPL